VTLFDQWGTEEEDSSSPLSPPEVDSQSLVTPGVATFLPDNRWNWTQRTREEVLEHYRYFMEVALNPAHEDVELRKEVIQPLIDNRNRSIHKVTEDTNRVCFFCGRKVADVSPYFYAVDDDRHICICIEHKDHVGKSRELAKDYGIRVSYSDTNQNMEFMRKSTPTWPKKRQRKQKDEPVENEPQVIVKKETDEVEVGEVVDEVAEFLKKMGKI